MANSNIGREIPASVVYEDDQLIAIRVLVEVDITQPLRRAINGISTRHHIGEIRLGNKRVIITVRIVLAVQLNRARRLRLIAWEYITLDTSKLITDTRCSIDHGLIGGISMIDVWRV